LPEASIWRGYVHYDSSIMAARAGVQAEKKKRVEAERDREQSDKEYWRLRAEELSRQLSEERERRVELERVVEGSGDACGDGGGGVGGRVAGDGGRHRGTVATLRRDTGVEGHGHNTGGQGANAASPCAKLNARMSLETVKEGEAGPFTQLTNDYIFGFSSRSPAVYETIVARRLGGHQLTRDSSEATWVRSMRQAARASLMVGLVEKEPRRGLVAPVDPMVELERRVGQGLASQWGDVGEAFTVMMAGARALDDAWSSLRKQNGARPAMECVRMLSQRHMELLNGSQDVATAAARWEQWLRSS